MRRTFLVIGALAYALAGILLLFIHSVDAPASSSVKLALSFLLSAGSLAGLASAVAAVASSNHERKTLDNRAAPMQARIAGDKA